MRCFPAAAAQAGHQLLKSAVYPSPAVISRYRLYLDVAWMVHMQDVHCRMIQEDGILVGLMDSSPQGNRNWLLTEYSYLRGDQIDEVEQAFLNMVSLSRNEEYDETVFDWAMKSYGSVVNAGFSRHILPPAGLGARHTSSAHKAHCWFHAHRLESVDWDLTQHLIGKYFSMALDSGPEAKIDRAR
eukprot:6063895-Pyramimonas_sp.AAC.1